MKPRRFCGGAYSPTYAPEKFLGVYTDYDYCTY
jgi:hypothetical protein